MLKPTAEDFEVTDCLHAEITGKNEVQNTTVELLAAANLASEDTDGEFPKIRIYACDSLDGQTFNHYHILLPDCRIIYSWVNSRTSYGGERWWAGMWVLAPWERALWWFFVPKHNVWEDPHYMRLAPADFSLRDDKYLKTMSIIDNLKPFRGEIDILDFIEIG